MPVVFLITIVAVLVGIFFAATGRGGELAHEPADHAPLDLGPVTAADVALLRPPTALWGYNMLVTDEALDQIARAMRERDVTIAYLREQLASLAHNGAYTEPRAVHVRQTPGSPLAPGPAPFPGGPATAELAGHPAAAETLETLPPADTLDIPASADTLESFWAAESPVTPEPPAPAAQETPSAAEAPTAETSAAEASTDPGSPPPADTANTPEPTGPPQTPLILKASAKPPPAPEAHEATQPSEVFQDPEPYETTQPSKILGPTQPSAVLAPDEPRGPQEDFNAHDWWAEQWEAAREEDGAHRPVGTEGGGDDDPPAATDEQGR